MLFYKNLTGIEFMNLINEGVAFILGGMFFWPVILVLFFGFWALSENNHNFSGVVLLALFVWLTNSQYHYLGFFDTWYSVVGFVVVYCVFGGAYSFLRWYLYLRGVQNRFIEVRDAFLLKYNLATDYFRTDPAPGSADEQRHFAFIQQFTYGGGVSGFNTVPKEVTTVTDLLKHITPAASKNKALILQRITYWPTSLLWFAISDVVREMAETVYRVIGGGYQKLANSMFNAKEIL
jgi:hypothetical protein